MRFFRNAMVCLIIFFIVAIASFCGFYYYSLTPIGDSSKKITVDIPYGSNRDKIAELLVDKKLIRSTNIFKLYLKLNDVNALQAGTYQLSKNMDLKTIINKIADGEVATEVLNITFKEGKTIKDLAAVIAAKTDYSEEAILATLSNKEYLNELIKEYWFLSDDILDKDIYYPLEGYLYPDTYDIYNLSIKQIIEKLLTQTKNILDDYKTEIEASSYSPHELLTLASIIEIEGKTTADRAKISQVFTKRLQIKMAFGSCVTAYYGIQKSMTKHITTADTEQINAYNTYQLVGLPVGPVSNPSESAINAALNPADTNYLYFVSDINGKIYFTKSLAEHQAKIKALKASGLWY